MNNEKKHGVKLRELDDLGLSGVDMAQKSKAPAYRRNRRKREALEVLRKSLGNVTATCERVGISRATFYMWRQKDAEFDEAVREINENTLDFVESMLMKGIKDGNAKLIMFYLMNKGRGRGYAEKPEPDSHKPVNIVISQEEAGF